MNEIDEQLKNILITFKYSIVDEEKNIPRAIEMIRELFEFNTDK